YLERLLVGSDGEPTTAEEVEQSLRQDVGLLIGPETPDSPSDSIEPATPPEEMLPATVLPENVELDDAGPEELAPAYPPLVPDEALAPASTASPQPLTAGPGALDALIADIDATVQQVYSTTASTPYLEPGDDVPSTERYLLFTLAGGRYAVSIPQVLEIGRIPSITPVPNVPVWVRGVINLRGGGTLGH
ncbi:MAG: hypothetical protein FJZ47_23015, partial [Candidatus Tectomicrobia bacterium]|nr:hypothetical protein [Candidatus Tectomicrobia bacterium]